MSRLRVSQLVLLLLVVTGYAQAESLHSSPLKIGILSPFSGNFASLGEDNRQGIEAALEVSKSQSALHLVYADSKGDPTTAISEFRRLVDNDKVLAVVAMRSPIGLAINPISLSLQFPILGGVGDKRFAENNKYAFQVWSTSDEEGSFLAKLFVRRKFSKPAIITTQDDWTNAVTEGFKSEQKQLGGSSAYEAEVLPADSDFRSILFRAKAKSPDVIFANLALAQIGPFLRQAREQQIAAPIYSNFWVAKKDVIESAGSEAVEGVRFVEMDTNLPTLRKALDTKYHSNPTGATLTTYISTLLLIQAASQTAMIHNPRQLYAALLKQHEIRTPDGPFLIQDRRVKFPLVEKIMKSGKAFTERAID